MEVRLFAYRKDNSCIHKMPALLKLFMLMLFCIIAFAGGAYNSLDEILVSTVIVQTIGISIFSIVLFILSDSNLRSLRKLYFVIILGMFIIVFRMMYFNQLESINNNIDKNKVIMITKNFGISIDGMAAGILYTIRFFLTTLVAQIIFETTSSLEIKNAINTVQSVIAKIFPVINKWNPAFVIALAINFVPMVFEEWNKVQLAVKARLGNNKKNIFTSVRMIFNQLEAVLSCLLIKAEIKRQAVVNRSCKN